MEAREGQPRGERGPGGGAGAPGPDLARGRDPTTRRRGGGARTPAAPQPMRSHHTSNSRFPPMDFSFTATFPTSPSPPEIPGLSFVPRRLCPGRRFRPTPARRPAGNGRRPPPREQWGTMSPAPAVLGAEEVRPHARDANATRFLRGPERKQTRPQHPASPHKTLREPRRAPTPAAPRPPPPGRRAPPAQTTGAALTPVTPTGARLRTRGTRPRASRSHLEAPPTAAGRRGAAAGSRGHRAAANRPERPAGRRAPPTVGPTGKSAAASSYLPTHPAPAPPHAGRAPAPPHAGVPARHAPASRPRPTPAAAPLLRRRRGPAARSLSPGPAPRCPRPRPSADVPARLCARLPGAPPHAGRGPAPPPTPRPTPAVSRPRPRPAAVSRVCSDIALPKPRPTLAAPTHWPRPTLAAPLSSPIPPSDPPPAAPPAEGSAPSRNFLAPELFLAPRIPCGGGWALALVVQSRAPPPRPRPVLSDAAGPVPARPARSSAAPLDAPRPGAPALGPSQRLCGRSGSEACTPGLPGGPAPRRALPRDAGPGSARPPHPAARWLPGRPAPPTPGPRDSAHPGPVLARHPPPHGRPPAAGSCVRLSGAARPKPPPAGARPRPRTPRAAGPQTRSPAVPARAIPPQTQRPGGRRPRSISARRVGGETRRAAQRESRGAASEADEEEKWEVLRAAAAARRGPWASRGGPAGREAGRPRGGRGSRAAPSPRIPFPFRRAVRAGGRPRRFPGRAPCGKHGCSPGTVRRVVCPARELGFAFGPGSALGSGVPPAPELTEEVLQRIRHRGHMDAHSGLPGRTLVVVGLLPAENSTAAVRSHISSSNAGPERVAGELPGPGAERPGTGPKGRAVPTRTQAPGPALVERRLFRPGGGTDTQPGSVLRSVCPARPPAATPTAPEKAFAGLERAPARASSPRAGGTRFPRAGGRGRPGRTRAGPEPGKDGSVRAAEAPRAAPGIPPPPGEGHIPDPPQAPPEPPPPPRSAPSGPPPTPAPDPARASPARPAPHPAAPQPSSPFPPGPPRPHRGPDPARDADSRSHPRPPPSPPGPAPARALRPSRHRPSSVPARILPPTPRPARTGRPTSSPLSAGRGGTSPVKRLRGARRPAPEQGAPRPPPWRRRGSSPPRPRSGRLRRRMRLSRAGPWGFARRLPAAGSRAGAPRTRRARTRVHSPGRGQRSNRASGTAASRQVPAEDGAQDWSAVGPRSARGRGPRTPLREPRRHGWTDRGSRFHAPEDLSGDSGEAARGKRRTSLKAGAGEGRAPGGHPGRGRKGLGAVCGDQDLHGESPQ
ncbi:collagen alpha-1(I) chain-like [Neovison vison]|uniref:collagen alpha-1(I) chain-like n=1 Tax=Neovison vison TaxID=452646 RepID=UPI001CF06910|nr:collagen alpha-1(I) chain-like [Neogale vison]